MTFLNDERQFACPLCTNADAVELYRHRGRIVRCRKCGLIRRDPIPLPHALSAIYRSDDYFKLGREGGIGYRDYFADRDIYVPYFRRKFRVLSRFTPAGSLLEIGAAAGFALVAAREIGWRVRGMDLSSEAVDYARSVLGLDVSVGGIDDLLDVSQWDAIALFQTIEHLPDVRGALARIRTALTSRGHLILTTPNHASMTRRLMGRFWISYRPEHLLYFDPAHLQVLLEQEGFAVEHISADDPLRVPISRITERATHYYLRRRLQIPAMAHPRLPVWLGDMQVIARLR